MKFRTNLSPGEMASVAYGLQKAVDKQVTPHYSPENPAEQELNDKADEVFELFCKSLAVHVNRILSE